MHNAKSRYRPFYFGSFLLTLPVIAATYIRCIAQELPIKPSRTISFETREASYIDVDLTADGKNIVFDILGDIYSLPIIGGEATQLTKGLACNTRPTWSPDGKYIAFISDRSGGRHLNIMNADGTSPRTLSASDEQIPPPRITSLEQSDAPFWLHNGNYIAVGNDLFQFSGGRSTLALKGSEKDIQFSSNGFFCYYRDNKGMHKYDLNTKLDSLVAQLPKDCSNVRISPDADWMTYVCSNGSVSLLKVRNLITNEDRTIVDSLEVHRIFSEHYAFTSDSRSIIIGFGGNIHRIDLATANNSIIPFKAQVNVELGQLDYHTFRITNDSIDVTYIRHANSSPDGNFLIFSALDRLYSMRLPNGVPNLLVKQNTGQFDPIYSPDGAWIAYVTWSDTEGGYLWRIPAHGGKPQKLTPAPAYYQYPTWSPDCTSLAILKRDIDKIYDQSSGQLQIIPVNGDQPRTIADSVPGKNEISFSHDGRRVIFMQDARHADRHQKPAPQLYSVSCDNSHEEILAISNTQHQYSSFEQLSQSPNGRYFMFKFQDDLYLIPAVGLAKPTDILDDQQDVQPIRFAVGGIDPHWEKGGEAITWSCGNRFNRIQTTKILEQATKNMTPLPDQVYEIDLKAPTEYAHGTIALYNARIITMRKNEVMEHGTIIIKDGRFTAIGPIDSVKIPKEAKVFELSGKTIIPGLIDLHDHVRLDVDIFPQQAWQYFVNLAYGVTTARDPSTDFASFGLSELLRTGQMLGPRLFSVGVAVTRNYSLKNYSDAENIVKNRARMGAVTIKQYAQDTRLQKEWLLLASSRLGLNMTNEGEYIDPMNYFAMIKDGSTGIEHNAPQTWGNAFADVKTLLTKSGTWLTPTLLVESSDGFPYFAEYYRRHPDQKLYRFWTEDQQKRLSKLSLAFDSIHPNFIDLSTTDAWFRHNGMKVTLGSHGNLPGIGAQFELWAMQMGGLTNLEALQSATIDAAEGLGMQQDIGSIEPGNIADLLVLDKDPLVDIHNTMSIHYIMKDGQLLDGNTLDSIWPKKKKCPIALGLKGSITNNLPR